MTPAYGAGNRFFRSLLCKGFHFSKTRIRRSEVRRQGKLCYLSVPASGSSTARLTSFSIFTIGDPVAERAGLEPAHRNPSVNGLAIRCSTCYAYRSMYKAGFSPARIPRAALQRIRRGSSLKGGPLWKKKAGQFATNCQSKGRKKSKRPVGTSLLRNFLYSIISHENRKIIRLFSASSVATI